jgi:hypothetical protein
MVEPKISNLKIEEMKLLDGESLSSIFAEKLNQADRIKIKSIKEINEGLNDRLLITYVFTIVHSL